VLSWPFPILKYKYIFQIKYTEATLSTRKLSLFEIREMLIAVLSDNFVGVIYYNFRHTLSFPVPRPRAFSPHAAPCRAGLEVNGGICRGAWVGLAGTCSTSSYTAAE